MMIEAHIAQALPEFRRQAESRMVDACVITRSGGPPVFDPDTGKEVPAPPIEVYSGKCELQASDGLGAGVSQFGDAPVTTYVYTLKVPISAPNIEKDFRGTVTSSRWDSALVGMEFIVTAGHAKSHATCRRMQVEVVG